ncbi:MAG: AraC family transcriptional regulator [Bacteroidota bacterium]
MFYNRGNISIASLSDQTNLSQRRLQQLFKKNFGMSPKSYSRVIKMQYHTFELMSNIKHSTTVPEGYYDQSHFIHELKKQTEMLPEAYNKYINSPTKKSAYLFSNLYCP